MGWDFNFGFMAYGERLAFRDYSFLISHVSHRGTMVSCYMFRSLFWLTILLNRRRHRRLMHHNFHPSAALRFRPHSLRAARNLLNRFLEIPDDVIGNLRQYAILSLFFFGGRDLIHVSFRMSGETIMSIAYGLQVKPANDPYIKTAEQGVHPLVAAAVPGAFLVDVLPFLKYVPEWVPGAGFQKKAREWKKLARAMIEVPFAAAKENIVSSTFLELTTVNFIR